MPSDPARKKPPTYSTASASFYLSGKQIFVKRASSALFSYSSKRVSRYE
jgi:hypothetical protein